MVVSYQANIPKAPIDTPWGWTTEAQNEVLGDKDNPNWGRYRRAHLYYYSSQSDTKQGYKLPIAKMVNGKLQVVFRGVAAAMAALNGARGGVDLPSGVKEKIYRVIVKYYKSFDKEAPELRNQTKNNEDFMDKKEELLEEAGIKNLDVRSVTCEIKDNGEKHYTLNLLKQAFLPVQLSELSPYGEYGDKKDEYYRIKGIASSTSVDSYGTEMSYDALVDMAKQMSAGIPILPAHNSFSQGGFAEWDEVIGRTYDAEVMRAKVQDAAEPLEAQYVLVLHSKLYEEEEKAVKLVKRLERGEPIGQSIGGWFDSVRAVENRQGQVERVIVDRVALDHVAITRAPANPDSNGLFALSKLSVISEINRFKEQQNMRHEDTELDTGVDLSDVEIESEIVEDYTNEIEDKTNDETTEDYLMQEDEVELTGAVDNTEEVLDKINGAVEEAETGEEEIIEEQNINVEEEQLNASDVVVKKITAEAALSDKPVTEQNLSKQNVDNNNLIVDNKQNSQQFEQRSGINTTSKESQEINMTPEQLEELVAKAVARAVEAVQPAEKPVVEVKDEHAELRTRLENAEAMVKKLLEEPVRAGKHASDFMRTHLSVKGAYAELCAFSRSRGETALPTFIEANVEKISQDDIGTLKLHELKNLLKQGLAAAEADGYFE